MLAICPAFKTASNMMVTILWKVKRDNSKMGYKMVSLENIVP